MSAIAELKAVASLDATQFKTGVAQVKNQAASAQNAIASMGKSTASSLKSVAQAVGVAFTLSAVVGFGKAMMQEAAEAKRFARAIGMTSGMVKQLGDEAEKTGASGEGFQQKLVKLAEAQEKVAEGNKEVTEAFGRLGISADKVISMPIEQLLLSVAQGAETSSTAVMDLNAIMGKGAAAEYSSTLSSLAKNGLPQVSKAAQEATDRLAAMNKQFATLTDKIKEGTIEKILATTKGTGAATGAAGLGLLGLTQGAKLGALFGGAPGAAVGAATLGTLGLIGGGIGGYKLGKAAEEAKIAGLKKMELEKKALEDEAKRKLEGLKKERELMIKSETDKIDKKATKKEQDLREAAEKKVSDIKVDRVDAADSLIKIGGQIGGQINNAAIGVAQRQLKELEIMAELQKDMTKLQEETKQAIKELE